MNKINWRRTLLALAVGIDLYYLFFLFTTGNFMVMTMPMIALLYLGSEFFTDKE